MSVLKPLREKIDHIDVQILDLLNQRTAMALEIGKLKKTHNLKLGDPLREKEVVDRLKSLNQGPMDNASLEIIYKFLMTNFKRIQKNDMKSSLQHKIGIVGMGLMGGSLYKAIQKYHPLCALNAWDQTANSEVRFCELEEVLRSDIIILALPIKAIEEFLTANTKLFKSGAIVLDIGSTKSQICNTAYSVLPREVVFIGGHPLVGKELSGYESSSEDLYLDKYFILSPSANHNEYKTIDELLIGIGAKTFSVSAAVHDERLALTSHMPHLVSMALALSARSVIDKGSYKFVPSSLKEMIRVGAMNAAIWLDILATNKAEVLKALKTFKDKIEYVEKNFNDLSELMAEATEIKNLIHQNGEQKNDSANEEETFRTSIA